MKNTKTLLAAMFAAFSMSSAAFAEDYHNVATACGNAEGRHLVENFAGEFMPNAYSRLEKARDKAMELQQVYNEEFPSPVSTFDDKYAVYKKVLDRLVAASAEYKKLHLEIGHYYLLHKAVVVTPDDLAKTDENPFYLNLKNGNSLPEIGSLKTLGGKEAGFAAKFMPESYALHQQYVKEYQQLVKLYGELDADRRKAGLFIDSLFGAVSLKANMLRQEADTLTSLYNDLYMQHRIGDIDADGLADKDKALKKGLDEFTASLPSMVKDLVLDPMKMVKAKKVTVKGVTFEMVRLTNRMSIGKYEVTQALWEAVMGNNPSRFKGANRPVEQVSWNDCQEFIKKLNSLTGGSYRLPTEEEWEYACRAGSTGKYGNIADGTESKLDEMGWYDGNSGNETHPVGQKKPNAFGLYDMHGNVWEWTSTAFGDDRVPRGGGWSDYADYCESDGRDWDLPDLRYGDLGLRLAATAGL